MYRTVKRQPGVRESFARAREVDIVVTSLASAQDKHGALKRFLEFGTPEQVTDLIKLGWVGDVQYLPFSSTAAVALRKGVRAVTLLELSDLRTMAASKGKHVVLVAGPCGECARTKSDALRPLMREPALRVWSHLVTDAKTAVELLQPDRVRIGAR